MNNITKLYYTIQSQVSNNFHFRNDVGCKQCFTLLMAYDRLLLFKECSLFFFVFFETSRFTHPALYSNVGIIVLNWTM